MTSRRGADPAPGDWRATLGRLALRLADQMLGPNGKPARKPLPHQRPEREAAVNDAAAEAARALEQALLQFESVLGRMEQRAPEPVPDEDESIAAGPFASLQDFDEPPADLDEFLSGLEDEPSEEEAFGEDAMEAQDPSELRLLVREVARRLEDAIDRFDLEGQRLAEQTARLSQIATRVEERLDTGAAPQAMQHQPPPPGATSSEPQFGPGNGPVDIVLAAVPGFQGLMEVQRALSALPASERASVVAYKNGEASLEVVLHAPLSAQQIVEGLRGATGHRLLIEEARPESNRLRLRFLEDGA